MKKIFLTGILILAILSLSMVSASQNMTETHMQSMDNETANTFEDVQNAIEKAEINSTVILNGTYESTGTEITINKDITLEGIGNATLDGNNKSRILNINASRVILKNINFINGNSKFNGGAITTDGQLTVINCSFANNIVDNGMKYDALYGDFPSNTGNGGAINAESDLTALNSTFINNSAHICSYYRDMGYISYSDAGQGSAIICRGNLNIANSILKRNLPMSIYAGNTSISNCIFESNSLSFYWGSNVSCINSSFNKCSSNKDEVIEIINGYSINLFIDRCNFTNCYNGIIDADGNVIINNSVFSNNKFDDYERSIITLDGKVKIFNSIFTKNTAYNTAVLNLKTYEMKNCTFTGNRDATVYAKDKMLDDSLKPFYLYEVNIKNKLSKVYYHSGKTIRIDIINSKSKKTVRTYDMELRINNEFKDDEQYRKSIVTKVYVASSDYLIFPVSSWKVGTYKISIKHDNLYTKAMTFKVTVLKAKTIIKAPKVTAKFKKSKYFKISIKNKATKKAVKKTYVKVKIGKKTYKIKTDSKGIAKFNTKKLKVGKYKVTITSGNSNYIMSAKSKIVIKR